MCYTNKADNNNSSAESPTSSPLKKTGCWNCRTVCYVVCGAIIGAAITALALFLLDKFDGCTLLDGSAGMGVYLGTGAGGGAIIGLALSQIYKKKDPPNPTYHKSDDMPDPKTIGTFVQPPPTTLPPKRSISTRTVAFQATLRQSSKSAV